MSALERQTVLVIDDHPIVRQGVRQVLEAAQDFQFVGEAADGATGVDLARQLKPDLILLDIHMKGVNGIETLKAIKAADLDSRVIMLTVSDDADILLNALHSDADGYLLKTDTESDKLLAKLRLAAQGQFVLSEELVKKLVCPPRENAQPTDPDKAGLTEREKEILKLIAEEALSNKGIARRLDIAEGTVKAHVKNLLKKLNLHSRVAIAIWWAGRKGQTDTPSQGS